MNSLINAVLMVGLAVAMAYVGPALDDHSAEQEQAKEAIAQQNREARFERAAQQACGMNSVWRMTDVPGQIVCLNKKGKRTVTASL